MDITLLVIGIVLFIESFVMDANKNFASKFVFNILPFLMGGYIVFYALVQLGFIIKS